METPDNSDTCEGGGSEKLRTGDSYLLAFWRARGPGRGSVMVDISTVGGESPRGFKKKKSSGSYKLCIRKNFIKGGLNGLNSSGGGGDAKKNGFILLVTANAGGKLGAEA